MKFPETKTRSPFYKMLSPLVEKAPMVPFISSFLRRRPGRALFAQMGRGARAQGPGRGAGACGPMSGQALFPPGARASGRQVFGEREVFQGLGVSDARAPPSLRVIAPPLPFRLPFPRPRRWLSSCALFLKAAGIRPGVRPKPAPPEDPSRTCRGLTRPRHLPPPRPNPPPLVWETKRPQPLRSSGAPTSRPLLLHCLGPGLAALPPAHR